MFVIIIQVNMIYITLFDNNFSENVIFQYFS